MRRATPGGTVHPGHAPGVPDMYEAPNGDFFCNSHKKEYCPHCCVDHRELNDMARGGSDAGDAGSDGGGDDNEGSNKSSDDDDWFHKMSVGPDGNVLQGTGDRTRDYFFEMVQTLGSQIFGAPLLETRQRAQARMLERMGAAARNDDEGRVMRARALLAQEERQAGEEERRAAAERAARQAAVRRAAAERAARQAAVYASWEVDLPGARGGGGGGGGGKKKKGGGGKKKGKGKGKGKGKIKRAAAGAGGGGGSGTSGGGGGLTTRAREEEEGDDEEEEQEEEEEEEEQAVKEEEEKVRVPDPAPEPEAEPDLMELHDDDCPICFMSIGFTPDEPNLVLDCQHTFHRVCLLDWRDTCRSKREPMNCPMCRQSVSQEDWNKMNE